MCLYKDFPLVPAQPKAPHESPTTEQAAPLATTAGAVTGGGDAPPPTAPVKPSPAERWSNGRWAVTEAGLESLTRAGPDDVLIDYLVPADRLLRTWPGLAGVSNSAVQLAGKSWVDDVDPLVEAIAQALRIHHPGQAVVDLATTSLETRREWERTHRVNAGTGELGWQYVPGEATIRAVEARAAAAAQEGEGGADRPEQDPAPDFVEAPEEDSPPEFNDLVEELIREEIEKRHR